MSALLDQKKIFVIIPAYNEQEMLRSVLEELIPNNYSIVVIDDGSHPSLISYVKGLPVYYLRHRINLGQGAALQTGIEFALLKQALYIVSFDADGQHQPADIPGLINALDETRADIVFGSRFLNGATREMPAGRKLVLQVARFINYIFTGLLLTDSHNGLRAMTASAAKQVKLQENRMAHATEILSVIRDSRLKYIERPVHIRYTSYSRSKGQTVWSSFRIFFDLLLNKIFK